MSSLIAFLNRYTLISNVVTCNKLLIPQKNPATFPESCAPVSKLLTRQTMVINNHFYPRVMTFQWRHNERDGVSNHLRIDCLHNRLFRRRSKKISKLRVTGLLRGSHRWPVNSPHKGPVTRSMFPFDDVIMENISTCIKSHRLQRLTTQK